MTNKNPLPKVRVTTLLNKRNNNLSFPRPRLRQILFLVLALDFVCASADPLTDRVAAAFNHESPKLKATIQSDDEIQLTTPIGSLRVFLDRVRGECQKRPEDCDATIGGLVTSAAAIVDLPDAMKFNPDNVYPVVRPENGLRATQASIGNDANRAFVSRPYISGAVLLYAIDTAVTAALVRRDGLSWSEVIP